MKFTKRDRLFANIALMWDQHWPNPDRCIVNELVKLSESHGYHTVELAVSYVSSYCRDGRQAIGEVACAVKVMTEILGRKKATYF